MNYRREGKATPVQQVLQFGDFQFDAEALLLTHGLRSLPLSPKALRILLVLLSNAGRVVSKDDLLNIVWPETAVEEGNLAVHIFALRRALGADTAAEYIETLPKRGYRFAAPVQLVPALHTAISANRERDRCRIAEHHIQQQTAKACRRAAAEYREGLKTEPYNAEFNAGLANTLLLRFVLGDLRREEAVPRAKALLAKAGRIDPASSGIALSRSRLFALGEWQWEKADEELRRAVKLAGQKQDQCVAEAWQGYCFVEQGQMRSGLPRLARADAAWPLSRYTSRLLAEGYFLARDFEGCVAASRKALQVHPHCWLLYRALGRSLTALGEYGPAGRSYRRAMLLYGSPCTALLAELAYLDAKAGKKDRARDLLGRLELPASRQQVSLVSISQIQAALECKDRALDYLEQACVNRDCRLATLKQDSRLDSVRGSDRYRRILAQVGL